MDRVYFGFRALLPAKCKECSEDYVIDHEPEVPPFFNCFRCFKGSHDCERNRVLHETLSKMNTPAGFVWLCDKCHDIVDPIEPRKHKSRHNSGTLPAGNHSSDSSNELSSIAFQNALSSTQRPPSENTPENHAAPPNKTCQNFLNWNCPHGMSGKKEVSGKCCSSIHPRVCNQFRMSGTTGRKGCKKGMNCPFFHPKICKTALDSGSCSKKDCSSFHPRSARKKNNNNDNNPNSAPRKAKQKQKGANQNDSYSKSSNFLELRNLVTGMATKLEAMEKKMSQGAPACQPAKFTDKVLNTCIANIPKKRPPTGKPKLYNSLRRRKSKLKTRLSAARCAGDNARIKKLEDEIGLVSYEIKEAIVNHLEQGERRAVERIKSNPKYFFSYAKSFSKVKQNISTLLNGNKELVTERKELANILQQQFCSVYSDPNCPDTADPTFAVPPLISTDKEIVFTPDSIMEAISEIKLDSAPGPDGIPAILLKRCASSLSVPIYLMWSESMSSGIVPSFYKTGNVSPLFKKGSKCEAGNYRPVTLTSHVVKVYERVIRKHMVEYLEANSLLTDKQHGFRANRSCLTQMLGHFDDIYEGFTRGEDTDSIYLDYAKAFDKVDLNLLIHKLKKYGFHGKLIEWIKSFLFDREQVVVLNGVHSDIAKVLSGVPQGSVLGPLLFILFINDLEQVVASSRVSFFADDTRVSKQIGCFEDCELLQEDIYKILDWSRSNNMKLHEQKFELLNHLHNSKSLSPALPFFAETLRYKVSSQDLLYPVENVRDLGVMVSSDLSWATHIGNMVSKARSTLSWVFSVFRTRDKTVMTTLYKSLVRSLLEYCCPLWSPTKVTEIQLIEGVQRTFTSRIGGLQHLDYWERLVQLKWMSLQRRRERCIILMMWKILHNVVPNCCDIKFKVTPRHGDVAIIPSLSKSSSLRNQSLYDRSFAVQGPKLWNKVPPTVKADTSFDMFKCSLSNFLALIPDNPPVAGYSCSWSNSLVDYSPSRWSDI